MTTAALLLTTALLPGLGPAGGASARRQLTPTDAPRLDLRVRPAVARAPAAIRVTAVIERHNANLSLTLTADCPRYRRSSTIPLDGEAAAPIRSSSTICRHAPTKFRRNSRGPMETTSSRSLMCE